MTNPQSVPGWLQMCFALRSGRRWTIAKRFHSQPNLPGLRAKKPI